MGCSCLGLGSRKSIGNIKIVDTKAYITIPSKEKYIDGVKKIPRQKYLKPNRLKKTGLYNLCYTPKRDY